jgi:hypothetical protein
MTMIRLATLVCRDPLVAYEVLDGEAVLYHERTQQIHLLNPIATLIWEEFDGRNDLRSVIARFVELSGRPFDVIQRDVLEAVDGFARLDLVVSDPESAVDAAKEEEGPDG